MGARGRDFTSALLDEGFSRERRDQTLKGFAFIMASKGENIVKTNALRPLMRIHPGYFALGKTGVTEKDIAESIGVANVLWKIMTRKPGVGFDAQWAKESLENFYAEIPGWTTAQNNALKKFMAIQYMDCDVNNPGIECLSEDEKRAIQGSMAIDIKKNPAKVTTLMEVMPEILLDETRKFAEAPFDQLKKLTEMSFFKRFKNYLIIGGVGIVALYAAPQLLRIAKVARR